MFPGIVMSCFFSSDNPVNKMTRKFLLAILVFWQSHLFSRDLQTGTGQWAVGVAKVSITPEEPMWMAGYAFRDRAAEGKLTDLWAKAIAFEDSLGKKAVLVTADIIRIPRFISDSVRRQLSTKLNLDESQIILNGSHTHTGPEMDVTHFFYRINPKEREKIRRYAKYFTSQVIQAVEQAFGNMEPAYLAAGTGTARFAVNRRNNVESKVGETHELKGPYDHAVPVLRAMSPRGKMLAIVFGYACHPTVLSNYHWSGDYPGFAQLELEEAYPEATALFFQGAGGDQNPLPRRSVSLAKKYGGELALAVKNVLEEQMRPIQPVLTTAYSEVTLYFQNPPPSSADLAEIIRDTVHNAPWIVNNAKVLEAQLAKTGSLLNSYPYPVLVWKLGNLPIFALGGEIVVDYSIGLKQLFGYEAFVMGYSNDVMEYIPSKRVLKEGCYEGSRSAIFTTPWRDDIEERIIGEAIKLADQVSVLPRK